MSLIHANMNATHQLHIANGYKAGKTDGAWDQGEWKAARRRVREGVGVHPLWRRLEHGCPEQRRRLEREAGPTGCLLSHFYYRLKCYLNRRGRPSGGQQPATVLVKCCVWQRHLAVIGRDRNDTRHLLRGDCRL